MPDTDADFVIQIFFSAPGFDAATRDPREKRCIVNPELEHKLEPGLAIEIACGGLLVIASILWIANLPAEQGVRVGLRFLGVSAGLDLQRVVVAENTLETERPGTLKWNDPLRPYKPTLRRLDETQ